ncbi:MAG: response regulator [Butyrivibrio sp.]|nr:response regulator [Butyrivibrio sp.]
MSRILVVDDDEVMLNFTKMWLQKEKYFVICASSGKEALSFLQSSRPDLILLDYRMPEMDGPAVLSAIRADEHLRDIPVYYRTGMDDLVARADDGPAPDGIIPKSEGKPLLIKTVAAALGTVTK